MRRLLAIFLIVMLLPLGAGAKGKRTSKQAQEQRQQTERAAAKTAKQLKANEAELAANLRKVTELEHSLTVTTEQRKALQERMDSIAGSIRQVEADIAANEAELERLRKAYVDAVRSARRNRRELDAVTFILSSGNFSQAEKRTRYLREFSRWRQRKAGQIEAVCEQLDSQRVELQLMQRQVQALVTEAAAQERKLKSDRASLEQAAGKLKGKQKQLNDMLKKQQATLTQLDREIQRLIEQELAEERRRQEEAERKRREQEKAANKSATPAQKDKDKGADYKPANQAKDEQTGGFERQKGKLPSPLDHTYKVALGFGVQSHRTIKTLQIDNTGIDLETKLGAKALAVYPGTVTAVYQQPGLHNVVMIRHGSYITIYANINATVSKGTQVSTGTVIGTVATSPYDDKCAQLHFEIRREREKLNPYPWLKH